MRHGCTCLAYEYCPHCGCKCKRYQRPDLEFGVSDWVDLVPYRKEVQKCIKARSENKSEAAKRADKGEWGRYKPDSPGCLGEYGYQAITGWPVKTIGKGSKRKDFDNGVEVKGATRWNESNAFGKGPILKLHSAEYARFDDKGWPRYVCLVAVDVEKERIKIMGYATRKHFDTFGEPINFKYGTMLCIQWSDLEFWACVCKREGGIYIPHSPFVIAAPASAPAQPGDWWEVKPGGEDESKDQCNL